MRSLRVATVLALVVIASSVGVAAASLHLGHFSGRTAQHQVFKFVVFRGKCDSPKPPFTFHAATCFRGVVSDRARQYYYPTMFEHCSNGNTVSAPLYAASYQLSFTGSGHLTYTVRGLGNSVTSNDSLSSLTVDLHGRHASGHLRQTEYFSSPTGRTITCDSGTVRFTAAG